jgi:arsenate reductase (thioredoxin)
MKNILFVCIENSNRSQMAEAFARIHGKEKVNAYSAGSRPSGKVNPVAIAAMKMLGYNLTTHQSKSVDDFRKMSFEYAVTMGCGDECPFISAKHHIDWDIPDPKNLKMPEFIGVRDLIKKKVIELLDKIPAE